MPQAATFEEQLGMLLPRVRRFAYGLSRHPSDADDLAAQAVERALRSREQWQVGSRLDLWLYRIVRNLWIDEARSRARRARWEEPPEAAETVGHDPRDELHRNLELKRVMVAMAQLPDEQREVIALILIEGFGYREVSEMLDLPIGTVSSRLVRGRSALLTMVSESE